MKISPLTIVMLSLAYLVILLLALYCSGIALDKITNEEIHLIFLGFEVFLVILTSFTIYINNKNKN
ncbi:hypothetical protein [Flavobacterium sp. J27]|uniref:hypothetical protein n=1 Tax=Flavobacterium sp. J27 TaxID=2060419 RepID=UPI00102FAE09|nr:hypothetical protein [Flavobacterium sp. J27]